MLALIELEYGRGFDSHSHESILFTKYYISLFFLSSNIWCNSTNLFSIGHVEKAKKYMKINPTIGINAKRLIMPGYPIFLQINHPGIMPISDRKRNRRNISKSPESYISCSLAK